MPPADARFGMAATPDPRKQECHASYLYGAGYFARDENTLGILTGQGVNHANFCMNCPARTDCEAHQRERVRSEQPLAAEEFDQRVREGERRGASMLLTEMVSAEQGTNPYYNDAIENFKRGHADRGRTAGTMTTGGSDAR